MNKTSRSIGRGELVVLFQEIWPPYESTINERIIEKILRAFGMELSDISAHLRLLPESQWWGPPGTSCYQIDVGPVLELIQARNGFSDEEMAPWYARLTLVLMGNNEHQLLDR